jgi:DNA-binding FadR family transcriptional regulator
MGATGPSRSLAAVFTPIRNAGLVDEICERIELAIESGVLVGGDRLPNESEFAASLGVSAVTAREALARMRSLGVVTTVRGRNGGSFIAPDAENVISTSGRHAAGPTRVELEDLRCHLQAIARSAAETAAERATEADIAQLRTYITGDELTGRHWRLQEWEFLFEVAAIARSARLTRELLRLQSESASLLPLVNVGSSDRAATLDLRRLLTDALAHRDPAAAGRHAGALAALPTARYLSTLGEPPAGARDDAIADIADFLTAIERRLFAWAGSIGERLSAYGQLLNGAVIDRVIKPDVHDLLIDDDLKLTGAGFIANLGVVAPDQTHFAWWQGAEMERSDAFVNFSPHAQNRYLHAEWFRAPLATGRLKVTGPYVDLLCTDDYIVTFTQPVEWQYQPGIVGVAGMDITLPALERRVLGSLQQIGPAVLVNSERRAVVSAASGIQSGDLVDDAETFTEWEAGPRFSILCR